MDFVPIDECKMGRDLMIVQSSWAVDQQPEDEEDLLRNGDIRVASVSLGSGDAWPCYWRPWFIAGYRMVLASDTSVKALALETILRCCPPNRGSSGEMVDYEACRDNRMFRILSCIGLDPLVEVAAFHSQTKAELSFLHANRQMSGSLVPRFAAMVDKLKPYVPYEADDLSSTPYDRKDSYNLADDRHHRLEAAFQKAATLLGCYVIVE